jgi:hypothetical protein
MFSNFFNILLDGWETAPNLMNILLKPSIRSPYEKAEFSTVFALVSSIALLIGLETKAGEARQRESVHQDYVPNELLVKLKEDVVGDIVNNKLLVRNVFNQVQGKIKTYLNEEIEACNWEAEDVKNKSFFADPYLFHIKIPEGINLD